MTMGHREPVKAGEELDATTGADPIEEVATSGRDLPPHLRRSVVVPKVKDAINHRERRRARDIIEEQAEEMEDDR